MPIHTSACVESARANAVRLGAIDAYDDCIGGDLRSPPDASPECDAALAAYRLAARERQAYVHGPELRGIYSRAD